MAVHRAHLSELSSSPAVSDAPAWTPPGKVPLAPAKKTTKGNFDFVTLPSGPKTSLSPLQLVIIHEPQRDKNIIHVMHINFSLPRLSTASALCNGKLIRPEAGLTHHFSAFAAPHRSPRDKKKAKNHRAKADHMKYSTRQQITCVAGFALHATRNRRPSGRDLSERSERQRL